MYVNGKCPIWGVDCTTSLVGESGRLYLVQNSFRAGGRYQITSEASHEIAGLDDAEKSRISSSLVESWIKGVEVPRLTNTEVQRARKNNPIPVYDRANRLLKFLARYTQSVGDFLEFADPDRRTFEGTLLDIGAPSAHRYQSALAWSESVDGSELDFLTSYLADQGWITKGNQILDDDGFPIWRTDFGMYGCRVEVSGYRRIEELVTNVDSSQCFVAMWFDDSMIEARNKGIIPAIEDAGYKPMIIDQKPDLIGKIEDEIIAEIRRSKFVVADFTHGENGVRGSVYYEAGFAHALGLKVIFTRRKSKEGVVHFDTDHFYRIEWEHPEDLRKQLTIKIEAAIGEGPLKTSFPT